MRTVVLIIASTLRRLHGFKSRYSSNHGVGGSASSRRSVTENPVAASSALTCEYVYSALFCSTRPTW